MRCPGGRVDGSKDVRPRESQGQERKAWWEKEAGAWLAQARAERAVEGILKERQPACFRLELLETSRGWRHAVDADPRAPQGT